MARRLTKAKRMKQNNKNGIKPFLLKMPISLYNLSVASALYLQSECMEKFQMLLEFMKTFAAFLLNLLNCSAYDKT